MVEAECKKRRNREEVIRVMSPLSLAPELEETAGVTISLYSSGSVYVTRFPFKYASHIHDRKVVDSQACAALVFISEKSKDFVLGAFVVVVVVVVVDKVLVDEFAEMIGSIVTFCTRGCRIYRQDS